MSRILKIAFAAALALGIAGNPGSPQADDWDDDDDAYYWPDEGYVVRPPRPVVIYPGAAPYGPPVYGWVYVRPQSCGEYRYWDGEGCRDARFYAPDIGPRW